LGVLLLIGISLFLGQVGANFLRRFKIPQVVGYILMGVLLGKSVLQWLDPSSLETVTSVALGLIGFTIGTQLRIFELRKIGKVIMWVAFLEAFGAFFLVATSVYLLRGSLFEALIFGALASATAPAATVDVLQEYKCKGILTTTLLAVVGIDDAIALLIYGIAQPFSKMLFLPELNISVMESMLVPVKELGGSIFLGILIGFIFSRMLRYLISPGERLSITLAVVFIASGLAEHFHLSLILTNMVMGITAGNLATLRMRRVSEEISRFTPPIYILFFAIVGAQLDVRLLPAMGLLGLTYILARAAGKFGGAYLGSVISGAPKVVRDNIGLGLFSQAGVAIGLSIAAARDFSMAGPEGEALGSLIINTIAATTFVVQMIGPSLTRIAVFRAGEARVQR
jgi:Kef-type K+ transport system membrane component KefB